jgi:predicted phage-related endonuclease
VPKKLISIPAILRIEREAAATEYKVAEARKEQADAAILAAMGDAEGANFDDGTEAMTYYEQGRKAVDTKRLQVEQPEIAAKYMKESKHRVLRTKKGQIENGE